MMIFPSSFFFGFFMVLGVVLCLGSSSLFLVWCGLEMNLMGFIPLIIQEKNLGEVESSVKYFVVQSFGSSFILLGSCLNVGDFFLIDFNIFSLVVVSGLMIKLGMFPFYFWLPSVMLGMSWFSCALISTWQKVAPMGILLFLLSSFPVFLLWLGVGSSIVGGILGMNQVNMKSLLAYSSISHMGWILSISQFSVSVGGMYLFTYIISSILIFYLLSKLNLSLFFSFSNVPYLNHSLVLVLSLGFLILSGIPPFLGFFPKFYGILILINSGCYLPCLGLILGTCFSLYYYMSVVMNSCCSVLGLLKFHSKNSLGFSGLFYLIGFSFLGSFLVLALL